MIEAPANSWPPTFTTQRLILRGVVEDDVDAIYAACSQPKLTEYTLFDTHKTREASVSFYRNYTLPQYAQRQLDPLAIARLDSPQQLIGCCGIMLSSQPHVRELGYWIMPSEWNQGFATEVTARLVEVAFADPMVQRFQSRVLLGNTASERVLVKCGFVREGVLRQAVYRRARAWDVVMYSRLRGE